MAQQIKSQSVIAKSNTQVVDSFFSAMEAQKFETIKEVFAENAVQLLPYAPEGFPNRLEGSEAIYNQFSGLTAYFSKMKFTREIYATEDPNFFFVKFKGDMELKNGGKYENDYLATFKLENGQIIEYTEYFNPIVMAKAFGLKIN
ncbi:PhzA/PhzB family protein [Belliella sp. DSM 111904]|uniref:PhzA/PhzB family protein n=2 Tax=Belliella filtrata TaxID=2923435 RepID=A0ABS9UVG1_9BACT|nr:PhzA/PhzB family protein [Belliella filtrata]